MAQACLARIRERGMLQGFISANLACAGPVPFGLPLTATYHNLQLSCLFAIGAMP
jgi:hypothetical protein